MRKLLTALAIAAGVTLAGCATTTGQAPQSAGLAAEAAAQPDVDPALRRLLDQVEIPYETFTLDNGLRVVVHEDRKAPVVAVSVWYNVGSKDEPAGRTGFAHLFEHMMFYGSENAPGNFFPRLEEIGATDWNGTTWFDRTNYFETVPTPALETALFLESDRMGHLLGAVTEEKLRNQIGVVQNEKRQGDNQPYGLVEYAQLENLFPEGHPYRHSTIGSMADLDAATLQTVHQWFRDKYGPNNAVLVLAGDIDTATARTLVQRYFGDIPRGPENVPAQADVPTLPARVDQVMHDQVATTRLYRNWVVPGIGHEDVVPLEIGASVLGGLASSRLDNILVRGEQTAVRVSAGVQVFHRVSMFEVQVDVKPGVDADAVSRRLDQIIDEFVAQGPTEDEVRRVVMQTVAGRIRGLEQVGGFGGKAVALAEGALYLDDPGFYRRQLEEYASATPAEVREAMQRWLSRPVYALHVVPGERGDYEESSAGQGSVMAPRTAVATASPVQPATHAPFYFRAPEAGEQPLAPLPRTGLAEVTAGSGGGSVVPSAESAQDGPRTFQGDRSRIPEVGTITDLDFPEVEHATLSNGVRVTFARRATVPVVRVSLQFDAGFSADPEGREGLQSLMAALLDEGTATRNSIQLAEEEERLGAAIGAGASIDRTSVGVSALVTNLGPSLDLLADIVKNPAFDPGEIERLRAQRLAQIASEQTQPTGIALRTLPPLLYGTQHPYGVPLTGSGTAGSVQAITREDIVAAHQSWLRPDNLEIFVVGDTTLEEITRELESRFGTWAVPAAPKGTKDFSRAIPPTRSRIVLIDRPQSPQSMILAGAVLPLKGTDDMLALLAANDALGGQASARLNMDIRETKGWGYGAFSFVNRVREHSPFIVFAPVQTNRTGESIAALQEQIRAFVGPRGVTAEELGRIVQGSVRGLPGSFETSDAVLGAIIENDLYERPADYQETLPGRYRALTAADLDRAARQAVDPDALVWVVVGDASQVRPQLDRLGLPVEVMQLQ
ncbi:pitrilysin family protein [Sphingosinicella sp. CPCC 101087]|uniref:M16 family metallopeptidase n=1 Tax=Sphingosinicella sp. CPCC 101087 TaxID=2497754 RepID=UPI00101CEEF3|nr:pitrilysin family protein [Sphingosinicella sp. CPCC 101087]